ncbi:MAG: hypothetical protein RLZZ383_3042 [Pseudomonadota bacterium]|jgi:RNA polymerase sigma factor for flagellar operon FliA
MAAFVTRAIDAGPDPRGPRGPVALPAQNRPEGAPRTQAERNRLVLAHHKLVHQVARRIHARLPRSVELDDLVAEGMVGLIDAVERYDAQRSVPLAMFARQRITGAILDWLRAIDWVPRSVRRRADETTDARETLRRRLGRAPTRDEVAGALGLSAEGFDQHEVLSEIRTLTSLDAPTGGEGDQTWMDRLQAPEEADTAESEQLRTAMLEAIERLPDKERIAVKRFYLEQRPLQEIGRELGVSESRASQLHRMGVSRLKFKVREFGE